MPAKANGLMADQHRPTLVMGPSTASETSMPSSSRRARRLSEHTPLEAYRAELSIALEQVDPHHLRAKRCAGDVAKRRLPADAEGVARENALAVHVDPRDAQQRPDGHVRERHGVAEPHELVVPLTQRDALPDVDPSIISSNATAQQAMIVRIAAGMRTVKRSRLSVASLRSRAPRRATHAVSGPTMKTTIATRRNDSSMSPKLTTIPVENVNLGDYSRAKRSARHRPGVFGIRWKPAAADVENSPKRRDSTEAILLDLVSM